MTHQLPNRIFLVGMPGSGKSAVGCQLAAKLGYKFIDLDDVIEGKANTKIAAIFEEKGEDYFRELEALSLTEVIHNNPELVLATGGGTPCFHDGMNYLNNAGYSIYLNVPLRELAQRLAKASHRPLINAMDQDSLLDGIKNKLASREPVYRQCDLEIRNYDKSFDEVVDEIISHLSIKS